ncbi:MAG: hypothetical protein LBT09_14340 [Planctomycetaceae bacterium]|jgi:hypothetical protein|nr:hypothetical protein [Planctomycetaceae bacterium]
MYRFFAAALVVIFFVVTGCHSFGERHFQIRDEFVHGQVDKAKTDVNRAIKLSSRKDADLLKLNSAIIELCSGRPKSAELLLREVRDNFDRIERERAANAARDAASLLTDDNTRAYSGEDYEKVLIRVFLAISNLMQDGNDAYAYALQINDKQNKIIESRKSEVMKLGDNNPELVRGVVEAYRNVAIGAYLEGVIQEETKRNYEEAFRAYKRAGTDRDAERAKNGLHSKSGNGVVYVIGLVGEGPYKKQMNCEVLRDAQIIATLILSHVSRAAVIPDIAPIMIPVIMQDKSAETLFKVWVGGEKIPADMITRTDTGTITDIGQLAEGQFEASRPMIIARAIVRRAFKKGVVYGMKDVVDANKWVGLMFEVGGMVWESFETADTRCWNLLPEKIRVVRMELPVGEHELIFEPYFYRKVTTGGYGALPPEYGERVTKKVKVRDGRNTYVLANFIRKNLIGEITVSGENNEKKDEK